MGVLKRQASTDGLSADDSWWWSSTAYAVKWAIVIAIFVALAAYFIGGYLHAKRRMKKGLMPLPYHRWLIPMRDRERFVQQYPQYYNQYSPYRNTYMGGHAYPMAAYGPPPPAYGEPDYVPAYSPPEGGTKVDPRQSFTAPPGPPPSAAAKKNEDRGIYDRELASELNAGPSHPPRVVSPRR